MFPELEEDFFHLERGGDGLNQDCGADGTVRHADIRLREIEDVVPETRLFVVLHLGKVEVGAISTRHKLFRVVEEVQREVEDRR